MEFKVFIKKFLKFWQLLVIFTVLAGFVGLIFNQSQPPQFKTSVLFYFEPKEAKLTQSSDEFTDTILGILSTKGFANLEIRKVAPQLLQFEISGTNQKDVEMTASNLEKNLELNLEKVLGKDKISIISVTERVKVETPPNLMFLNILVGAALGFAIAAATVSTLIYFGM